MIFAALLLAVGCANGLTLAFPQRGALAAATRAPVLRMTEEPTVVDKAQTVLRLFQESRKEGSDFKQAMADAIAGEYDRDAVASEVTALTESAPLVLFTWESSPACKKALKLLEVTGVEPKIVRLDDPWAEGNPKRAALGRLTGKSSVPSIWIGGQYIGGCDDGPTTQAPGLVPLAFQAKLRPMLEAAGASLPDLS